jgi:hypothetical protein
MGDKKRKVVYEYRETWVGQGEVEVPADVPDDGIEQWLNDHADDIIGDNPYREIIDSRMELDAVIDGWRLRYAMAGSKEYQQLMLHLEQHKSLTDGTGQWWCISELHVAGRDSEAEAWLLHDEGLEGERVEIVGLASIAANAQ